MPERFLKDDDYYAHRYGSDKPSSASWLVPLLLLPVAFLGGWVANGYVNEGQVNGTLPGVETGVGGGPDDERRMISPLPTEVEVEATPTQAVSPTPDMNVTPTETE